MTGLGVGSVLADLGISAGAAVILLGFVVGFRWLRRLQNLLDAHAERIAHLEGQLDTRRTDDDGH